MKKTLLPLLCILASTVQLMNAQEIKIKSKHFLNKTDLNSLWGEFSSDHGWRVLASKMNTLGYERNLDVKQMWGVRGTTSDDRPFLLCMYDFNSSSKKPGTMVWFKSGTKSYRAYILLGRGKDIDTQIRHSVEYYADAHGNLIKASSAPAIRERRSTFGKCFGNRLRDQCGSACVASVGFCAFQPFGLAGHVACVVGVCGGCATLAAVTCGFNF